MDECWSCEAVVARVLLQGDQMLGFFTGHQDQRTAIRKQLHQCKESLLRCEAAAIQVRSKTEATAEKVNFLGSHWKSLFEGVREAKTATVIGNLSAT